jgi:hypothetical protein
MPLNSIEPSDAIAPPTPPPSQRNMVAGLRGLINVQGGNENHPRKLYPRLARNRCDKEIVQRRPY